MPPVVRPRPAAPSLLALCVALALLAAGCGNKHHAVTSAETEGPYLTVGELKYQVQISRQLNPRDVEDSSYLEGIAAAERSLSPDETWFAVFIRVVNETGRGHPAAEQYEIEDTQGRRFEPVQVPGQNPFVFRPAQVPPGSTLPTPGSIADEGPVGGSLVLFKLTIESLGNRPLELHIRSTRPRGEAMVALDV
jgi:hypothetical protein